MTFQEICDFATHHTLNAAYDGWKVSVVYIVRILNKESDVTPNFF